MDTTEHFLNVAIEAVTLAKPLFVESFGRPAGVEEKVSLGIHRSPVTEVDKKIELMIREHLSSIFPDHSIFGEEFPETKKESDYTWYIDPIDGTINFIRGLPFCSISLGLWKGNTPVVGVVLDPMSETLYSAVTQKGAYKNKTKKLSVSSVGTVSDAIGNPGRTAARPFSESLRNVAQKAYRGREFGGGAMEICSIAEGKLDFYISERGKIYDFAAALLILTEAGGIATDWQGKAYTPNSAQILVDNGHIHDELLRTLKV